MYANNPSYQAAKAKGRPKRYSVQSMPGPGGKKAAIPLPVSDDQYDQAAHWPVPTEEKKICCLCQSYARITCEKCKSTFCLNGTRNCFKDFHIA